MVKNKEDTYSRGWIVVINNYTDDDVSQFTAVAEKAAYAIAGYEVGKCGTPHIQGYLYFKSDVSWSSMKKKITRGHIEAAKGTASHNYTYCSKDGNLLLERGVKPKHGKRTDIDEVRDILKQGGNMRDVLEKATSYQSARLAELYLKYHERGRDFVPIIRWYHGSTGSGKTRQAVEWLGDDYYTPASFKWWEGYDGHANVLIDDIRGDWCKYNDMLRLLDRYKYRVECKGGSRQFLAEKIAITSPYPPQLVFHTIEDVEQLVRRIDEIILVGDPVDRFKKEDEYDPLENKISR